MKFSAILKQFVSDDSGQDLIEYALVASLVALAAVAGMNGLATQISSSFNAISTQLSSAI